MNRLLDLIVIGAGPAGMAAAATAAECGLSTLLIDEQAEPGGQIYRSIESVGERRPDDLALFGDDYAYGAHLARELRRSAALYLPSASVFQVTPAADEVAVAVTVDGVAERLAARLVIVATGAMERPVPVPGRCCSWPRRSSWTPAPRPSRCSSGHASATISARRGTCSVPAGRRATSPRAGRCGGV